MSVYWATIHGLGYAECPSRLSDKLIRLSWVQAAAWKQNSDRFALALAVDFRAESTASAKRRLQKELNANQGPIGKQLPNSGMKVVSFLPNNGTPFRRYFHDFDVIKGEARAIVPVAPRAEGDRTDHLAVLGLEPGATPEDIRTAYRREALMWHPDKATGDQARFVTIKDSYEALMGISPQDQGRSVLVAPRGNDLLEEIERTVAPSPRVWDISLDARARLADNLSYEEAERLQVFWISHRNALQKELQKAKNVVCILGATMSTHQKRDRRRAAEEFVQRFRKSARYWDKTELKKCWFRPETGLLDKARERTYLDAYGPDHRSGNEDLDPYVIFETFHITGAMYSKQIRIKVGLDREDAVDFGISLVLPLIRLISYKQKLADMGFDVELADELDRERAWDQLHAVRLIDYDPHEGLDLDVQGTSRLYRDYATRADREVAERKRRFEAASDCAKRRRSDE